MRKVFAFIFILMSLAISAFSQTALTPGDMVILGMNTDNPDAFAFVFFSPVDSGTQIMFTDCGWKDDSLKFRKGEGAIIYTAPTALTAGTIVNYDSLIGAFAKYTGAIINGNFQLSSEGDQIIAFQGNDTSPSFIYAINNNDTLAGGWNYAYSTTSSALPQGLIEGTSAFYCSPETDNIVYSGITAGTKAALLASIGSQNNWSGSNSVRQNMPTGSYAVTGIEGGVCSDYALFSLQPCSPNPSCRFTNFAFNLARQSKVQLVVFNMLGQKVSTVYNGSMAAGHHVVSWDLADQKRQAVPNGIYFYQLSDGKSRATRRFVILR
jgi:hypothetical protein